MNTVRTGIAFAIAALWLLAATTASPAQEDRGLRPTRTGDGRRMALVIGNNAYPDRPLRNAVNDANAMADVLKELGFTVTVVHDTTLRALADAVDRFTLELRQGDLAFFFYAGHGVQVDNTNYLIPVDFDSRNPADLPYAAYAADRVLKRLQQSRTAVNLIVLDACRDNPFLGTRSGSGGLAGMQAMGTLIAYATAPGATAADRADLSNGLFTGHLVAGLREPGFGLREIFMRVREQVYLDSNGLQFPWVSDGLISEVVLRPGARNAPDGAVRPSAHPMVPSEGKRPETCDAATGDTVAVCNTLREWEAANEALDAKRVKRVWPNLDTDGLGGLFRRARSLDIDMRCGAVEFDAGGTAASVTCSVAYRYQWREPRPDAPPALQTFDLVQKGATWIIQRLR